MSGWARSASTISLSPFTTVRMPAGKPASTNSSASMSGTEGARSEGFRMKALPAAMAGQNFHIGIMAGKLNGVRSEEHTSELQSLMRISYAVFCLKKKKQYTKHTTNYSVVKQQASSPGKTQSHRK